MACELEGRELDGAAIAYGLHVWNLGAVIDMRLQRSWQESLLRSGHGAQGLEPETPKGWAWLAGLGAESPRGAWRMALAL